LRALHHLFAEVIDILRSVHDPADFEGARREIREKIKEYVNRLRRREFSLDEMEDVSGAGVGYAASALSGVLGRLGLQGIKVFEEGETIEAYVPVDCTDLPYADPVVSALLVALADGAGEVLVVEETGEVKGHLKLTLKKAGGVERWL